ncbi:hypothetical protein K435DRAFT_676444, partial [Dendrothele bispora CBS 962.96]
RPTTPQELYNLRHASARNVVERVFGVVKKRWAILTRPPQCPMDIQACIPPALVALHNFILKKDENDLEKYLGDDCYDEQPGVRGSGEINFGSLADGYTTRTEKQQAENRRDEIAQAMWEDYLLVLAEQGEQVDSGIAVD